MGEPLDVSLRIRMRYDAGGAAAKAIGDVEHLQGSVGRLGNASFGDRLGRDLGGLVAQAGKAERGLHDLSGAATKLGAGSSLGRFEADLKRVEAPAQAATRQVESLGHAATRLGAGPGTGRLQSGLKDVADAGGTASRSLVDLAQVTARFGAAGNVAAFTASLKTVEAPAQAAAREVVALGQAATRLGAAEGADRLQVGLKGAADAGAGARRTIGDLSQVTARFGGLSTVSVVAQDLRSTVAPAQAVKRELQDIRTQADRLGSGRGVHELERELVQVTRRAEEADRRLSALQRRMDGGLRLGGGHRAQRWEFGNEALMASGMGGAMRLGMSGAGIGGILAGGAVAATAGGIAKASREAISFESAMAEVKKAVNDITPEAFADLERTILRVSRTTGIAKEEMAKLVAQAGFAGRPANELARFAEYGAKAAKAFTMSEEATGEALAKLGTKFKLPQAGIEDLGDGINVLADNASAKEAQIIDFLYRTGDAGNALKLAPLQLGAIGAAAISTGKASEVAGTGFNAFALKLGMASSQGKDFQSGLRALGTNARRVKAEIAANPVEGVLSILEKIDKLPDNKKLDVAGKLGGGEYADDLLAFAGAVQEMRKSLALMQDQATRSGSVEKTFKIFDATTQASINRTTAAIDGFAAKIGQRFTPAIQGAAGAVERWFSGMTKAMEIGERAAKFADKIAKGGTLTPAEQAEVDANPKLKAETERKTEIGRAEIERRAIIDQERRERATGTPQPTLRDRLRQGIDAVAGPEAPRPPDEQDKAANDARERTRQRLQSEMKDLQGEIATRAAGGFETLGDRRRLQRLQQQYAKQFPAAVEKPAPPPSTPVTIERRQEPVGVKPKSEASEPRADAPQAPPARALESKRPAPPPSTPVEVVPRRAPPTVSTPVEARPQDGDPAAVEPERRPRRDSEFPGTGQRSDLAAEARVNLAAYHAEMERGLTRTERLVRETGRRMNADLVIKASFEESAPRLAGGVIQTAAYGGSARFGGTLAGPGRRSSLERSPLGTDVGGNEGAGSPGPYPAARPRIGPGRFGLVIPDAGPPSSGDGSRSAPERDASSGSDRPPARDVGRFGGAGGGGPVPPAMMDRARQLYGALRKEGFSHPQSAAILGHAEQESGIGVRNNPREGADGIIHWRQDRLQKLRAFAAERGETGNGSLPTQAAFMRREMDTDPLERRQSERFRRAETVDEASAALKPYIRYGDNSTGTRTNNARRYDQAFRDGGVEPKATAEIPQKEGPERMGLGGSAARRGLDGVDPRLTGIMRDASKFLPEGYNAKIVSGLRPGDRRFHGAGMAADVAIYDKAGRQLGNYQDAGAFRTYERFAQAAKKIQTERHPELNNAFRWGGYFGGAKGKYGALDTMHFDLGGNRVGMGGGSFEKGLTPQQRALFPGAVSEGMGPVQAFKLPEAGKDRLAQGTEADERAVREEAYRSKANPFRRRTDQPAEAPRQAILGPTEPRPNAAPDRTSVLLDALRRAPQDRAGPASLLEQRSRDWLARDPSMLARTPSEDALRERQQRIEPSQDRKLLSPRFSEPAQLEVNARGGSERGGARGAQMQTAAASPPVTQHFHGGFDEQATARRAVLEQNREIRRSQARSLHDIGRVA